RPPSPAARIELGPIVPLAIHPARIERRIDANDDAKLIAILERQVVRPAATHGSPGKHVAFTLGQDRIVCQKEAPHILHDVVLEGSRLAIEVKAAAIECDY